MPITPIDQVISDFPVAPNSNTDTPSVFNTKANAFVAHQADQYEAEVNQWAVEANTLAEEVDAIAIQINDSIATLPNGSINDSTTSGTTTFSSNKIEADYTFKVDTVDDLSSVDIAVGVVIVKDLLRGGTFVYDASAGADDGGTIFSKWVRQYDGAVNVKWFGAGGASDDTPAIVLADAAAAIKPTALYFPAGSYNLGSNWTVLSKTVRGEGITDSSNIGTVLQSRNNSGITISRGYYSDISDLTIRNDESADSSIGITISNSPVSTFTNIRVFGCETGIRIITNDGNNNRVSSWSMRFTGVQVTGCKYGLLTDGNEVNDFSITGCTFNGILGWSAEAEDTKWYGDNPNIPTYGIKIDTSLNQDDSAEISIGGWYINETNLERHEYGSGFYLTAGKTNSSPVPIVKDAVNIRSLHLNNIYAEKCKDTIVIDIQDKGRCYGLCIENINSASDGESLVRLLGSSEIISSFGFFRGAKIDSGTISSGHSIPSSSTYSKINIDGLGKSLRNSAVSLCGELLTIPIIINNNDSIVGDGTNASFANCVLAGGLLIKKGHSHRIVSMSLSSDVVITTGDDKALAITPDNCVTSYYRDDYSSDNIVEENVTERFIQINAVDTQVPFIEDPMGMTRFNNYNTQCNFTSTLVRNIMRFTVIKDVDFDNDRVFNFDGDFVVRKNGTTQPLENKVFGSVVVEVWNNT